MKQIDRLIIKARKISVELGEDIVIIRFSDGEWVSDGRRFQSLEEAEQFFSENSKTDLLFIVNDVGAGGPHPLWAAVTRQKARYRRREKRRLLAAEKERREKEELERLERAEELKNYQEMIRQEQEKETKEKQEQRRKTVGRVI